MKRTESCVLKLEPLSEAAEYAHRCRPDFTRATLGSALLRHTRCLLVILHNMGDLVMKAL